MPFVKRHRYEVSLVFILILYVIIGWVFQVRLTAETEDASKHWDYFRVYWDIKNMSGALSNLSFHRQWYYYQNTQQQFYMIVLRTWVSLWSNVLSQTQVYHLTSSFLTGLTVIIASLSVKLLQSEKTAQRFNLLVILFVPFMMYAGELYTDTLALPFVAIGFYSYLWVSKGKYMAILPMVVSLSIGLEFKMTTVLLPIAILLYEMLKLRKNRLFVICLVLCLTIISSMLLQKGVVKTEPAITQVQQNRYKLPLTHWIAMSFDPENVTGGFYNPALKSSQIPITYHAKQTQIKSRLKVQFSSVTVILRQIKRKWQYSWGDGLLGSIKYTRPHLMFHIVDGNSVFVFLVLVYSYIFWLTMLSLIIYTTWKKRYYDQEYIMLFSIVGIGLFLTIWEANSRYLYVFVPFILALSAIALERGKFHDFINRYSHI